MKEIDLQNLTDEQVVNLSVEDFLIMIEAAMSEQVIYASLSGQIEMPTCD